jgi:hypothetical protein
MQIDRDQIEASLLTKGFIKENSNHRYFYHEIDGKRTGAYTFTSHGSKYKVYTDTLLSAMKTQLRLKTLQQTVALLNCNIDGNKYNDILKFRILIIGYNILI